MSSRLASLSSQQLRSAGFFCGRPCDMELVTRQSERPSHQQRLLQTFTEDVFIFSLGLTCVHSALELSGRYTLQIYLLTYLLIKPGVAEWRSWMVSWWRQWQTVDSTIHTVSHTPGDIANLLEFFRLKIYWKCLTTKIVEQCQLESNWHCSTIFVINVTDNSPI